MLEKVILMMKNTKVLETNKDGSITIYEEKLLPFSLQKEDLTYEDFSFNWLAIRPLSIGRTNAKAEQFKDYLSKERVQKIEDEGEIIVRSKLITDQQTGIGMLEIGDFILT